MGKGLIRISLIAVRDILGLPEEYEFLEAAYNPLSSNLEILIKHPHIPAAEPGTRHIEVKPIYQAEQAHIVRLKEVKMVEQKKDTEPVEKTMKRLGIRRRGSGNDRAGL